jgi:hypothetical protein
VSPQGDGRGKTGGVGEECEVLSVKCGVKVGIPSSVTTLQVVTASPQGEAKGGVRRGCPYRLAALRQDTSPTPPYGSLGEARIRRGLDRAGA